MKFRTELEIRKSAVALRPELPVALVGSCFADNIARRMRRCLWDARTPLGVLFNPLSIAEVLRACLPAPDEEAWRASLFERYGLTYSWLSDSSGTAGDLDASLALFRDRALRLRLALESGGTLIVTFGTAYCYFLSGRPDFAVANCHKQPQSGFVRRRVGVDEILEAWRPLLGSLRREFPTLRVILTVSPVRHLRDGFHDNTLSKAVLHLAAERICSEFGFCEYFPAFELVADDLRDYRFYADDLLHPSPEAVEYIWEKFKEAYVDGAGLELLREGEALCRRFSHRPLIPDSPDARAFAARTAELLADFRRRYPATLLPQEI